MLCWLKIQARLFFGGVFGTYKLNFLRMFLAAAGLMPLFCISCSGSVQQTKLSTRNSHIFSSSTSSDKDAAQIESLTTISIASLGVLTAKPDNSVSVKGKNLRAGLKVEIEGKLVELSVTDSDNAAFIMPDVARVGLVDCLTSAQTGNSFWSLTHHSTSNHSAWKVTLSNGYQNNTWWTYTSGTVICVRNELFSLPQPFARQTVRSIRKF
jgi:hypothetical protein